MKFEGVSLDKLMKAVGANGERVVAVALNDYSSEIPIEDFAKYKTILALKRDGEYMPVRDKGPLFVVYPVRLLARAEEPEILQPVGLAGRAAGREVSCDMAPGDRPARRQSAHDDASENQGCCWRW